MNPAATIDVRGRSLAGGDRLKLGYSPGAHVLPLIRPPTQHAHTQQQEQKVVMDFSRSPDVRFTLGDARWTSANQILGPGTLTRCFDIEDFAKQIPRRRRIILPTGSEIAFHLQYRRDRFLRPRFIQSLNLGLVWSQVYTYKAT